MSRITMSQEDCTIWRISDTGMIRLSGEQRWFEYATPAPLTAIATGGHSDDVYALLEDQTLVRLVRNPVQDILTLTEEAMQELSVGQDGTICVLAGSDDRGFMPYVLKDQEWQYWGAALSTAISVVSEREVWLVSRGQVHRSDPRKRGAHPIEGLTNVTWVSGAEDGMVLATTPDGVFRLDRETERWREFAQLPAPEGPGGMRVVCGSADFVYASSVEKLWRWNGAVWNAVEAPPLYRISVAPDGSVVGLSRFGVVRSTSFSWEVLPGMFGSPSHTNIQSIWALPPLLGGSPQRVVHWPGTSWQTLEKTPVTSLSVGSGGEVWGINLLGKEGPGDGDIYRRNSDGTWTLMKPAMSAIAVGSSRWVAALDGKQQARFWDPDNQWSDPLPMPAGEGHFHEIGIGDDGALMARGDEGVYQWIGPTGKPWVKMGISVNSLQVINRTNLCGFSSGVWVGGAFEDPGPFGASTRATAGT